MKQAAKATMPVANSPCYECPDRVLGYHGTCEKYKEFKEERVELAKQIRKKAGAERSVDAVLINGVQIRQRRKHPER